ncbi:hypothetical protein GCM10010317_105000 [Streptomyces mirabilis]|nr:hypothetical protein GCM10010317_105000 [Streptomyces mirabilis]
MIVVSGRLRNPAGGSGPRPEPLERCLPDRNPGNAALGKKPVGANERTVGPPMVGTSVADRTDIRQTPA